jgi:hypothetical protein
MKLESLKKDKFKDNTLKKEQMFQLNGGGVATPGGTICGPHGQSQAVVQYDYGYDAVRNNPDGTTYITYHNRSNVVEGVC